MKSQMDFFGRRDKTPANATRSWDNHLIPCLSGSFLLVLLIDVANACRGVRTLDVMKKFPIAIGNPMSVGGRV